MKYTSGRNLLSSNTGAANYNADLTIEETSSGVRVSGTGGTNINIYGISTRMNNSSAIKNYIYENMGGTPICLSVTVTNNGTTPLSFIINGLPNTSVTVLAGSTMTAEATDIYKSGSYIGLTVKTESVGDAVDFTYSNPYIGFGELPDTVSQAPELSTTDGTAVASDSIVL